MGKLPTIKRTPIPEHQIQKLQNWFRERFLDLKMRESDEEILLEFCKEESLTQLTEDEIEEQDQAMKALIAPYDDDVKVGQVRLLSPKLIDKRIAHVLVLRQFPSEENGPETFLVVPIGPYETPATRGELEISSDESQIVLQCWLARTVSKEQLKLSWIVDELNEEVLKEAKAIWKHSTFGKEIPIELQCKIGPPIQVDNDPRLLYQEEELELWAGLTSLS